jgi:hypothetical protein
MKESHVFARHASLNWDIFQVTFLKTCFAQALSGAIKLGCKTAIWLSERI